MISPHVAQEKAKGIIERGLETQFQDKVRFVEIRITPRAGDDDEEYLDVLVIYEGRPSDLNPRLLNSLYGIIEKDLRAIGIEKIPTISFREKAEDSGWSHMVEAYSPGGEG